MKLSSEMQTILETRKLMKQEWFAKPLMLVERALVEGKADYLIEAGKAFDEATDVGTPDHEPDRYLKRTVSMDRLMAGPLRLYKDGDRFVATIHREFNEAPRGRDVKLSELHERFYSAAMPTGLEAIEYLLGGFEALDVNNPATERFVERVKETMNVDIVETSIDDIEGTKSVAFTVSNKGLFYSRDRVLVDMRASLSISGEFNIFGNAVSDKWVVQYRVDWGSIPLYEKLNPLVGNIDTIDTETESKSDEPTGTSFAKIGTEQKPAWAIVSTLMNTPDPLTAEELAGWHKKLRDSYETSWDAQLQLVNKIANTRFSIHEFSALTKELDNVSFNLTSDRTVIGFGANIHIVDNDVETGLPIDVVSIVTK